MQECQNQTPKTKHLDHLDQTLLYIKRLGLTYAEYQKIQTLAWLKTQELQKNKRKRKKHGR